MLQDYLCWKNVDYKRHLVFDVLSHRPVNKHSKSDSFLTLCFTFFKFQLNNPTLQLSVSRLTCHPEEAEEYPPTPMLVHRGDF
jgi:hypothetical protein